MHIFFDFLPRAAAEIFVKNPGTMYRNRENRLFINRDYWRNKLDGKNVQVVLWIYIFNLLAFASRVLVDSLSCTFSSIENPTKEETAKFPSWFFYKVLQICRIQKAISRRNMHWIRFQRHLWKACFFAFLSVQKSVWSVGFLWHKPIRYTAVSAVEYQQAILSELTIIVNS